MAAFTEFEIGGTTLDYLSRSGIELNKFGVKNLMHQVGVESGPESDPKLPALRRLEKLRA